MNRLLLSFAVLVACAAGDTTPPGTVGSNVDLRQALPADVRARAPNDADAEQREFTMRLEGVSAKILWRTFNDAEHKYLLSYQWEVLESATGIMLEPLGHMNPVNLGTPEAVVEAQTARVRWHDSSSSCRTRSGEQSVQIDGAGKASVR